jgi:dipeptidyl aminopeptidase/acylaminoacyl peptidase
LFTQSLTIRRRAPRYPQIRALLQSRAMNRLLALLLLATTAQAAPHPFGFDDLIKARRISGYDVSPDGKWVAFTLKTVDLDENKITAALWIQSVNGGGEARQITAGAKHDLDPHFSPDGKRLAFTSDRDGTTQIYLLDLAGGEARPLTHLHAGMSGPVWSPDGKFLVATSEVFPDCTSEACNRDRAQAREKIKGSGRVIERLLFRHWDSFSEGKRIHLFRVDAGSGEARDLTPGNFDTPPFSLGGGNDYDVSPDGKFVVYASNHDAVEAASTNGEIWEIPSVGGAAKLLSDGNKAYDGTPKYSPDGKHIAWRAQSIPGYESDEFDLILYDRQTHARRSLTEKFPDWVEDFSFSVDGKTIFFSAPWQARMPIFSVPVAGGEITKLTTGGTDGEIHPLPDGSFLFARTTLKRPTELWKQPASGAATQLTRVNDALFAQTAMGEVSERWYAASDGKKVQALLVTPPGFDAKKKYPALFWVHGGPQGAWDDGWSYRWNPEVLASAGYVVYLPNPRGSTGYGQEFVRGVSGDWGGKVFDDLMRGADDLASLPYVAKDKIGAAGASFGGFMINWFQGHTDRFAALFCHDGISDQETMYATEELWFPEFEFGGKPWASEGYRKASPIVAAASFKTPELVVHGEKDYRIPVEQAILMFTVLQRKGIPSKLLLFPDENHWVLKPQNARLWYATMIDWFHRFLGGAAADKKALESAASYTR